MCLYSFVIFLCIFLCVFATWILTCCFMFPGELMFWFGLWCAGYESYCDLMCCWWIVTIVGINAAQHTTMFLTSNTYIFSTQLQLSNGKCKKQGSNAKRRRLSFWWEHRFIETKRFPTLITYIFQTLLQPPNWKCKKQGSDVKRQHLSLLWEHVFFFTRKFVTYEMFLTLIRYISSV